MMRSYISITWTPGVDIRDAQILGRAIEDIFSLVRPQFGPIPGQFDPLPVVRVFGAWAIPAMPGGSPYSNIEWYVNRSLADNREDILASRYLDTVILEPWQGTSPHFDLALTDLSITDDVGQRQPTEGALGFSRRGLISLISTRPFEVIGNYSHRGLALQHTCAHYIGRLFDAPRISRRGDISEQDGDLYCANTCAMRYTETPYQALIFAREEARQEAVFCRACQVDIAAQITAFHYGLN